MKADLDLQHENILTAFNLGLINWETTRGLLEKGRGVPSMKETWSDACRIPEMKKHRPEPRPLS